MSNETILRKCNQCGDEKPLSEYHNQRGASFGKSQKCKVCACALTATYRDTYYNRVYANKYKVSEETIAELLAKGKCDICGSPSLTKPRHAIDHCHTTGKVRGLLCWPCNKGLGNFKDNPELIQKAIKYLEQHATN